MSLFNVSVRQYDYVKVQEYILNSLEKKKELKNKYEHNLNKDFDEVQRLEHEIPQYEEELKVLAEAIICIRKLKSFFKKSEASRQIDRKKINIQLNNMRQYSDDINLWIKENQNSASANNTNSNKGQIAEKLAILEAQNIETADQIEKWEIIYRYGERYPLCREYLSPFVKYNLLGEKGFAKNHGIVQKSQRNKANSNSKSGVDLFRRKGSDKAPSEQILVQEYNYIKENFISEIPKEILKADKEMEVFFNCLGKIRSGSKTVFSKIYSEEESSEEEVDDRRQEEKMDQELNLLGADLKNILWAIEIAERVTPRLKQITEKIVQDKQRDIEKSKKKKIMRSAKAEWRDKIDKTVNAINQRWENIDVNNDDFFE